MIRRRPPHPLLIGTSLSFLFLSLLQIPPLGYAADDAQTEETSPPQSIGQAGKIESGPAQSTPEGKIDDPSVDGTSSGGATPGDKHERALEQFPPTLQETKEAADNVYREIVDAIKNGDPDRAAWFVRTYASKHHGARGLRSLVRQESEAPDPESQALAFRIGSMIEDIQQKRKHRAHRDALQSPSNDSLQFEAARICASEGDYGCLASVSSNVLKHRPKDPEANYYMAQARLGQKDYKGAVASASEVLGVQPDNPYAMGTRAAAWLRLGEYEKAAADAKQALTLNPEDEMARSMWGAAKKQLELSGLGAGAPRIGVPQEQERPGLTEPSGPAEPAPARNPELEDTSRRLEAGPVLGYRAQSLYKEALTRIELGDYKGAAANAGRAIELSPGSPEPYATRAAAYNHLKDYASAIRDASRSLDIQKENPAALDARAWALNQTGKPREALEDSKTALRWAPKDAFAYLNKAKAEEALDLWDDMVLDYQTAAGLNRGFQDDFNASLRRYEKETGKAFRFEGTAKPFPGGPGASPDAAPKISRRASRSFAVFAAVLGTLLAALLLGAWSFFRSREPVPESLARSQTLLGGNFQIIREIGRGGMGIVYEAMDLSLDRKVAIKKMKEDIRARPKDKERFLREARTVAGLKHPAIVEIHLVFEEGEDIYMVFEYVPGMTLDEHLFRKKRLSPREAGDVLRPVCEALSYAHSLRVIHRDLKPANIMLSENGQVKVMDFGLARQAKDTLAALSRTDAAGTPAYMAPEQERGEVRIASDIFMLGGCLYEMLTGELPFGGPRFYAQKLDQSYTPASEIVEGLPKAVDAVIACAMAPRPEDRYPTAKELLAAFEEAINPDQERRGDDKMIS